MYGGTFVVLLLEKLKAKEGVNAKLQLRLGSGATHL